MSQQPSVSTQKPQTEPERANFVGVWRLVPGEDLIQAAKKLGQKPPSMELEAYPDGTFDLVGKAGSSEFEVSGEFFVHGREVMLRAKEVNGEPIILQSESEPRAGKISEDGETFLDDGGWVWKRTPQDG